VSEPRLPVVGEGAIRTILTLRFVLRFRGYEPANRYERTSMTAINRMKALLMAISIGFLGLTFAACSDDNEGNNDNGQAVENSANDAGNSAEDAANDAGDAIDNATDDVSDAANDAANSDTADDIGDAASDAADEGQNAAEDAIDSIDDNDGK
jgi:hypothetical protein